MKLVLDCREKKLISLLVEKNVAHSVESLPLGDICIRSEEGNLVALFERKTIQDLLSSISDGRYDEQSYRLRECGLDRHKIFYIIEGNIDNYIGKGSGLYSKNTVHGCLYSLSFVKGFSLLCSNSLRHTSELVIKFFQKVDANPEHASVSSEQTSGNYIDSVKLSKKGNVTDEMVPVMMLAQIPKVSKNVAEEIMKRYEYRIDKLIMDINTNKECLDNLVIPVANNKVRKISKPCLSNLKKYLLTIEENEN